MKRRNKLPGIYRRHKGAVVAAGKVWSRQERRRLTLRAAKVAARRASLSRADMHRVRDKLMRDWPDGTFELLEGVP